MRKRNVFLFIFFGTWGVKDIRAWKGGLDKAKRKCLRQNHTLADTALLMWCCLLSKAISTSIWSVSITLWSRKDALIFLQQITVWLPSSRTWTKPQEAKLGAAPDAHQSLQPCKHLLYSLSKTLFSPNISYCVPYTELLLQAQWPYAICGPSPFGASSVGENDPQSIGNCLRSSSPSSVFAPYSLTLELLHLL